jgi:hypothetical protein
LDNLVFDQKYKGALRHNITQEKQVYCQPRKALLENWYSGANPWSVSHPGRRIEYYTGINWWDRRSELGPPDFWQIKTLSNTYQFGSKCFRVLKKGPKGVFADFTRW